MIRAGGRWSSGFVFLWRAGLPLKANEPVFEKAIQDVAIVAQELLDSLTTNREEEAQKARERFSRRLGTA